jgi:hypothetical protein
MLFVKKAISSNTGFGEIIKLHSAIYLPSTQRKRADFG